VQITDLGWQPAIEAFLKSNRESLVIADGREREGIRLTRWMPERIHSRPSKEFDESSRRQYAHGTISYWPQNYRSSKPHQPHSAQAKRLTGRAAL